MSLDLPLDSRTVPEMLVALEANWAGLCGTPEAIGAIDGHRDVLAERTLTHSTTRDAWRMIAHSQFGELRLVQFRRDAEIVQRADWEFKDALWIGEAIGFSEWLRLKSDPESLRSLAMDFTEFPTDATAAVLQSIDLPIRAGMRIGEVRTVLDAPIDEHRFMADRVTYEFIVGGAQKYNVSCTVLNDGGLSYLVVMRR